MARAHSAATTDESTPPERPKITRSFPTCSRIAATESSMIESMVQVASRPQMLNRKLLSSWLPYSLWRTSGWNCVANSLRSAHSMEATGHTSVAAVMTKPLGTRFTASRWLIDTVCSAGVLPYRALSPWRTITAGPYSPFSVWPTEPPSVTAIDLLAVAKAQHGNAKLKHAWVDLRGVFGVHAGRAAGQDDCGGVHGGKFVGRHVAGDDSRKHAQVSDAAGNELSVLCAEI